MQGSARLGLHSRDQYRDFVSLGLKYETETETETQHFGISRLFQNWNLGFFKTETFQDWAKIVETKTFSILSSISVMISPVAVSYRCPSTVPSTKPLFYSILYIMVLTFGCKVPSNNKLFDGTVPSRKQLFDRTVPSNSFSLFINLNPMGYLTVIF